MKLTSAQRIIALLMLTALATTVSAGCGKEETFVVVTTRDPVEEYDTIEDALYAGDVEPPCGDEDSDNGGGGDRRGLRSSSTSISASTTGQAAKQVDRELGNDCPYICCWLCRGWPPGRCFIWSWTFTCRGWKPEKCYRRELEEEEELQDSDFKDDETHRHHRLKAQPAVENEECRKIIDDEEKKLKKAHVLYSDWNAMEGSKFDCVTAVPECEDKEAEKEAKEQREQEEKEAKALKEQEEKELKEREKKEEEEAKEAEKAAKEAEKAAKEAEKAEEEGV